MSTSSILKDVHLELVERECLETNVEMFSRLGNVFAGTREEFEHYHDTEDGKLFAVTIEDSSPIGVMYVISKVNRSIATEIALRDPRFYDNVIFEIGYDDIQQIENCTCINFSSNTFFSDMCIGNTFRNIYQYSLNTHDMEVQFPSLRPTYDVETRQMPCCLDDILEFDKKLFSIGNRRDFIETCARRSDAIYVVKKENEVTGFGMLSKPVAGKRLFGPAYVAECVYLSDLLYCLFHSLSVNPLAEKIVAFVSDEFFGYNVLSYWCFEIREPLKMWRRKSCVECDDVVRGKVVAMSSLLFDIY